jgi:hypothetical protein
MYDIVMLIKKSSLSLRINFFGGFCNRALINLKTILDTYSIENKNKKKNKLSN